MERVGVALAVEVNAAAAELGVAQQVSVVGRPSCLVFTTRDADVGHTVSAVRAALLAYRKALEAGYQSGPTADLLGGRPLAPALRRRCAGTPIAADCHSVRAGSPGRQIVMGPAMMVLAAVRMTVVD
jgi:glutamate-1-semialdehyde 2,1-aminomutase